MPLAKPEIGAREEELALEVLRSGQLSLGPMQIRFEDLFAAYVGSHTAAAVSSGTTGLHLAIRAAGVEAGDEVVTSPLSFIASANVMLYENAVPVFADIDPKTLNIDPVKAAAAVSGRTRGLLPVHIFGYPAAMSELEGVAADHDLWIVEDACEALGSTYEDGGFVGARDHMAVFGFYANKQLATGEGGMITCPTDELKQRIASERNQGRAPDMGWLDHDMLGFNYRLSELACALGVAQLEKLDEMLVARRRVAASYLERFESVDGVDPLLSDDHRSWFVFVVLLEPGTDRDQVIRLLADQGVASKPYLPTIHLQPFYRDRFGHAPGDFPIAEAISDRALALPFFPALQEAEIDHVVNSLRSALVAAGP